jgi:hypothetical protein
MRLTGLKQVEPTHRAAPQLVPQVPQFVGSLVRSTHAVPQALRPGPQIKVQTPLTQNWFVPQTVPHAPQFFGSTDVSLQLPPPQSV